MTNCAVVLLNFAPTQQLNQPGPMIEPAPPCEYTSYGAGWFSSLVLLAFDVALKKFLNAVRPATDCGESRLPTHLPEWVLAMEPPKSYTKLIAKYQSGPAM